MNKESIRTLVVGGTGFIGLHLVHLLHATTKRQIVVVGRRSQPPAALPTDVRYVCADAGKDDALLLSLLGEADEVIDLAYATVPKTSFDDPVHDILSNLPANVNMLQKASNFKLRRFLLVSSGGTVYGNSQQLPIDEKHPTNPVSPYGITKLAVEKYALMFHELKGLPVVIVRPGNPYGPHQFGDLTQGFIGAAMYAALNKQKITVFGEHGTVRDYIHIDDLCQGILAALDHGNPGDIFNIGTGVGHSNREVLEMLSSIINHEGYSLEIETLPARSFDVAANILGSARLTSASGWCARTSLDSGLRSTWDWVSTKKNKI